MTNHEDRTRDYLSPPRRNHRLSARNSERVRRALDRFEAAYWQAVGYQREVCLMTEAIASSRIENIYDDVSTPLSGANRCYQALLLMLDDPGSERLLEWHRTLLSTEPRKQPGQWRSYRVRVGDYIAPDPERVPDLMAEFLDWYRNEKDPVLKAIHGHRYFETIHPFVDGNGRTGRMLIMDALEQPVPVSRPILADRYTYYRMLNAGTWPEYRDWMAGCIVTAATWAAQHLEEGLPDPSQRALQLVNADQHAATVQRHLKIEARGRQQAQAES